MSAQQFPFKLYSRLINNRPKILISLQDLHIAIDEKIPLSTALQVLLPKLGFALNQDYIEGHNNKPSEPMINFLVTPETALIYLNTFEMTDKVKDCIKKIAQILSDRAIQDHPSLIEQEIKKQNYITQTDAFLKNYFGCEHYFLGADVD